MAAIQKICQIISDTRKNLFEIDTDFKRGYRGHEKHSCYFEPNAGYFCKYCCCWLWFSKIEHWENFPSH